MPKCNQELLDFPSFDRRKIEGSFSGGDGSSDGGIMALRTADRRTGLLNALDRVIKDPRGADQIKHRQIDLLRQRVYGLALGYEDLNDHDTLRRDVMWQSAVERGEELTGSPTLCRLENRADRHTAWAMSRVGDPQVVGHTVASAMAQCEDHLPWRLGLLPMENASLV